MIPIQLQGQARIRWETCVIEDARIQKATDAHLIRTLLDFCHGKAQCWPSTDVLSYRMRLGHRSIQLAITRCTEAGVIAQVKGDNRMRRIVFTSHPDADRILGLTRRTIPIPLPVAVAEPVADAQISSRRQWWDDYYRREAARASHPTSGIA